MEGKMGFTKTFLEMIWCPVQMSFENWGLILVCQVHKQKVINPLSCALLRLHMESCVQFEIPLYKQDFGKLEWKSPRWLGGWRTLCTKEIEDAGLV